MNSPAFQYLQRIDKILGKIIETQQGKVEQACSKRLLEQCLPRVRHL